jgi:hypothetical protein
VLFAGLWILPVTRLLRRFPGGRRIDDLRRKRER